MQFYVVLDEAHKAAFLLLAEGLRFSVQYHGVHVLIGVEIGCIAAHRVYILQ